MCGEGPDNDLVASALAGDAGSFAALCERYRERLWRIACSVARGADAEDLAQDAVVRAFRALRSYKHEAPFEAWLCRIAVNLAHDHLRSAWRRRVLLFEVVPDSADGAVEPEDAAALREVQRRVRQAVAALPERQRVPIWLHYFEGFSVAEIARLDGAAEATVRSRVRAGLRRLSVSLDDLLPSAPEPRARVERMEPETRGCGA